MVILALGFLSNSCVTESEILVNRTDSNPQLSVFSNNQITIRKTSKYYLGLFTFGEYDKYESNIYGQLRMSLYSEARFKYPDYDLFNIEQFDSINFYSKTYIVQGSLIKKVSLQNKMNLIVNHKQSEKGDELAKLKSSLFKDSTVVEKTETDTSKLVLTELTADSAFAVEVNHDAKKSTHVDTLGSELNKTIKTESISIVTPARIIEKTITGSNTVLQAEIINHEKDVTAVTENPSIIYIVACFNRQTFTEDKFSITEQDIDHPLEYYFTKKWVRIYLKGEIKDLQAARLIYKEAWPCRYGS